MQGALTKLIHLKQNMMKMIPLKCLIALTGCREIIYTCEACRNVTKIGKHYSRKISIRNEINNSADPKRVSIAGIHDMICVKKYLLWSSNRDKAALVDIPTSNGYR